jgi:hypothetical protein
VEISQWDSLTINQNGAKSIPIQQKTSRSRTIPGVTSTSPIRTQHAEDVWMKLDSIMTHLNSDMNVTHNTMIINKLITQ